MNNDMNFISTDVERDLPWLQQDLLFRKIDESFDPNENFGNSYATYQGEFFSIRFARDRGDILASVSSPQDPNSWFILQDVCALVSGYKEKASTLVELGDLFQKHYDQIARVMGPDFFRTKPQLNKLYQNGLKEYYDRVVASRDANLKRPK